MANGGLPGQVNIADPARARQRVTPVREAFGGGLVGSARQRAFSGIAGFGSAISSAATSVGKTVAKRQEEAAKEQDEIADAEAGQAYTSAYQEAKNLVGDPENGIFTTHKGIKAKDADTSFYDGMNEIEKKYSQDLTPEAKDKFLEKFRRNGLKLQTSLQNWSRSQIDAAKRGNMKAEIDNHKDNARLFSDEDDKMINEEKELRADFDKLADFEGWGTADRKDRWETQLSEFHDSGMTALINDGKIEKAEKYMLKNGHKIEFKRAIYLSNHLKKVRGSAAVQRNVDNLEKNIRINRENQARNKALTTIEAAGYKVVPTDDFKSKWATFSGEPSESLSDKEVEETYKRHAKKWGLSPDIDDPRHKYDYRKAIRAGQGPDKQGHWPSKYKAPDHPRRFVDGVDTITKDSDPAPRYDTKTGHKLKEQIEDIRARVLAHPESDYVSKAGKIVRTNKDKKFTKSSLIQKLKELESLVDTAIQETRSEEEVLDTRSLITNPKLQKEFDAVTEDLKKMRQIKTHSRNKAVNSIMKELDAFNDYTSTKQEAFIRSALKNVKGAELTPEDERIMTRSIEENVSGEMRTAMIKEVQQRFKYRREQAKRIDSARVREIENTASGMSTPRQLEGLKSFYGPEYYKVIDDIKEDRWGEEIEVLKSKRNANLVRTAIDAGFWSYVDDRGVTHRKELRTQDDVLDAVQTMRHEKNLRMTKEDLNKVLTYQAKGPVSMTKFKDALEALTGSRKMDDYEGLYDIVKDRLPAGREVSMEDIKSELAQWFVRDVSTFGKGQTAYKKFVEDGTLSGFDLAIPDVDTDFADQDEAIRGYLRDERKRLSLKLNRKPTDNEFRTYLKKRIVE